MFEIFKTKVRSNDPRGFLEDASQTHIFTGLDSEPKERIKRKYNKTQGNTGKQTVIASKQYVLDYLVTIEGKKITNIALSRKLKLTPSYVSWLVREMEQTGTIRRTKVKGGYKFKVNHKKVNKTKKQSFGTKTPSKVSKAKAIVMPEASERTDADRLLDYIGRHEDRLIKQRDIGIANDMTIHKVQRILAQLENDHEIVSSLPTAGGGKKYWLYSSTVDTPPIEEEEIVVAKTNNGHLYSLIDTLVWQYMTEQKSTDILQFLSWLQDKKD